MPTLRRSRMAAGFVSLFFGLVAPLCAQSSFELAPLYGYYRPTGDFAPASVYSTRLPVKPSDLSGTAWGAQAQLWLGRRLGVQVQAAVANSIIPGGPTPGFGPSPPTAAQVLVVTAQGQYDLSPSPDRYRIWVSAGPGLVRHEGDAYSINGNKPAISLGGALGAGLNVPIVSRLSVTAGADLLLYPLDVKLPPALSHNPGSLESGFQRDALVHVGLAWSWR
jgi:hypothetical protein